jgi:hypothetical protein
MDMYAKTHIISAYYLKENIKELSHIHSRLKKNKKFLEGFNCY